MENTNKSKANIHNQKSSTTPAYLKELDRMIQNHTNIITKKLSLGENSENFKNESEKILAFKKTTLKILSFIDDKKLKSVTQEQEEFTLKYLKGLEEFSDALFQGPERHLSQTVFSNCDESFIDLISATNNGLEKKSNKLLREINYYENLDLKSIKKLQGVYQENANDKHVTNYLVQLAPLQRELSYIMENLEGKKLKLLEKENTNKFNSSKAKAYQNELDNTSEKFRNALAIQESCEKELAQLLSDKNSLESELKYFQENLTEKINKKNKKVKVFKFKESDEKAKMLNYNNQVCLQEIEKAQMLSYDLRNKVKNLRSEELKNEESRKNAQMLFLELIKFKILQIEFNKKKARKEYLERLNKFLEDVIKFFELLGKNEELAKKKEKDDRELLEVGKRFEKFLKLHDKLEAENAREFRI